MGRRIHLEMSDEQKGTEAGVGHRQRLRSRFLLRDEAALSDESLVELLLTFSIPRRDVRPVAISLLQKFGSIRGLLGASKEELESVSGIKESSTLLIHLVDELQRKANLAQSPTGHDTAAEAQALTEETEAYPNRLKVCANAQEKPKLQVSNGYSFDAPQTASLLKFLSERPHIKRFSRRDIMKDTGLSEGQAESLRSIGSAMGLVAPRTQVLTDLGNLIVKHDLFFDSNTTLEFLHFMGAGTPKNLIWFTIFNELLHEREPMDQPGWAAWLREKLAGGYSPRSLVKHLAQEVRFVLDAYNARNFSKLRLLQQTVNGGYALQPLLNVRPLVLAASIYRFAEQFRARLFSFNHLHEGYGSPGRVFGIAGPQLRELVESLHQKGWVRFEVRHGLNQVRLIEAFDALSFLEADFENRVPQHRESAKQRTQATLL
jgi:hypothetical protein